MSFGGVLFIAFVSATWLVHRLVPARFRTPVLVVASYFFYAGVSTAHALLLLGLTLFVWGVSVRMTISEKPRDWLIRGISGVVLILVLFKYTEMATGTFNTLSTRFGLPQLWLPDIVAPLGLSFFSFMLISYLVEVYRGAPAATLPEFTLYASFFPTVVSGPIKRWMPFRKDLEGASLPGLDEIASAAARILVGMVKKFVVADSLVLALDVLRAPAVNKPTTLLLAVYLTALWIYFDFSGYADMAIGIARLFGFRIIENFNRPYLRRNLAEFWSNWHISLTRFFTEYVFIPLGGSRKGALRTAVNSIFVMALSGLWHGAAWHFVVWGLLHGIGLVVVRLYGTLFEALRTRWQWFHDATSHAVGRQIRYGAGVVVTFNFVAASWVMFVLPTADSYVVYRRIAAGAWHLLMRIV